MNINVEKVGAEFRIQGRTIGDCAEAKVILLTAALVNKKASRASGVQKSMSSNRCLSVTANRERFHVGWSSIEFRYRKGLGRASYVSTKKLGLYGG